MNIWSYTYESLLLILKALMMKEAGNKQNRHLPLRS